MPYLRRQHVLEHPGVGVREMRNWLRPKRPVAGDWLWPGLPVRNRARKLTVGTMAWPAKGCFPLVS